MTVGAGGRETAESQVGLGTDSDANTLTDRFLDAVRYATVVHRHQRRKGSKVPYVGHLLGVASLVIDAGASEDEAIAALLHDAAEDQGGAKRLEDIRTRFGQRVASIVEACSDSLAEDPRAKAPWVERKRRYVAHLLSNGDASVHLVSAADKLHNAQSMLSDFRQVGDALWTRFSPDGGRDRIIVNYRELIDAYRQGPTDHRRDAIVRRLSDTVDRLEAESVL